MNAWECLEPGERKAAAISIACFIIGAVLLAIQIRNKIVAGFRIEKHYTQLWALADKSSTLPAKQKYIAAFVAALEAGRTKKEFATHDAVWLKTPNNSFEENLGALRTLSLRLSEIQEMNPNSFEYNTAMQQITAQEQGEAGAMISVFRGCYNLANYPSVWDWIGSTVTLIGILLVLCGAVFTIVIFEWI